MKVVPAIAFILLCTVSGCSSPKRITGGCTTTPTGQPVNEDGTLLYGELPPLAQLHPEEVERDFRRIYKGLISYRSKHGRLPERGVHGLVLERVIVEGRPIGYEDVSTPDWQYQEMAPEARRLEPKVHYGSRFLGETKRMHNPPPGHRFVWVTCSIYARMNTMLLPDCTGKQKMTGFIIGLFSDGEIRRIAYADVLTVPKPGSSGLERLYPGESDIPPEAIPLPEALQQKLGDRLTWERYP